MHAWLKHAPLFLSRAFDAHYQDSPFIQTPEMLAALLKPTATARYAEVVRHDSTLIFSFSGVPTLRDSSPPISIFPFNAAHGRVCVEKPPRKA